MRAVDTNVLVRLITRDNEAQVRAAERFIAEGAWVPQLALVEMAWVLEAVYGNGPTEIADAIERFLDHRTLSVQDPETVAEGLQLFRERPAVGFADALMLATARRAGHLPLGTFDRDLGRMDGAELL